MNPNPTSTMAQGSQEQGNQQLQSQQNYPRWMTVEQTAEYLQIKPSTVYTKVRQGKLKISPLGTPIRIDRLAIDAEMMVAEG